MPDYSLQQIAAHIDYAGDCSAQTRISGVAELGQATSAQLGFADSVRLLPQVRQSQAAAILVPQDFPEIPGKPLWHMQNPRLSFLRIAELFALRPAPSGVHPHASVAADAELGLDVSIEACAVIGAGARIGARCRVGAGVFIAAGVVLGDDCLVEANASLLSGTSLGNRVIIRANASIASEGFGFAWLDGQHRRIPQLGRVEIGDDVEIGCNSCVDRATLGVTRIGKGSKIDNQVHVAHNCDIGEHVLLLAQVALAGSVKIGSHSVLSGKVGVLDHINIGSQVKIGGRSGVTKDIKDGANAWGWPARDIKKVMREQAALTRLPQLGKTVRAMQKQIEDLQRQLDLGAADETAD